MYAATTNRPRLLAATGPIHPPEAQLVLYNVPEVICTNYPCASAPLQPLSPEVRCLSLVNGGSGVSAEESGTV